MSRHSALFVILLLAGLLAPAAAFAQLTPPAGSAGAGNSPISGVPFGPANPRVLSDPSGIGNASTLPALGKNTPVVAPPAYRPIGPQPSRVAVPYPAASQRIINARPIRARKPPFRDRRARPRTSSFKGICRGC